MSNELTDAEMVAKVRRWLSSHKETEVEHRWLLRTCTIAERHLKAAVYQCPKCGTGMEVDPSAKPSTARPEAPRGWKLVPVEPTNAMLEALYDGERDKPVGEKWDAMLAAAPQLPQSHEG